MAQIISKNQLHSAKRKTDNKGNVKRKLFVKDGNSTMLFCKNITDNGVKALCSAIYRFAEQLGVEIEVTFLKTN